MLTRLLILFRWCMLWLLPTLLLAGVGILLTGTPWGAGLGLVYPVWLVIRLFIAGASIQQALPPRVGSGGRFEELLPPQYFLEIVREPSAWAMVTRSPGGSPRLMLTEGLLQTKTTEQISAVVRDLQERAVRPDLSLRTFAASLGVGRRFAHWEESRMPFSASERRLRIVTVAWRLVCWSGIRFMERLLGAPILGGKDQLAIRY